MNTGHTVRSARQHRTALSLQFLERLKDGCSRGCDFDEAEGGLVNHCRQCQVELVTLAYDLFVNRGATIGEPAQRTDDPHAL